MSKYSQVFKLSWDSNFVYRFNFVLLRVRTLISFLAIYFFWVAVFRHNNQVFDYSRASLLTYVVVARFVDTLVFNNNMTGEEIASGNLNNYLIKPVSYLKYWFTRDLGDKLLSLIFFFIELALIMLILRPPLFFPAFLSDWLLFLASIVLAAFMYFYLNFLVNAFTFWYPERGGWPLRFLVTMLLEFLTGGTFPLDILPAQIYAWFKWLPFGYLTYFPAGFYLHKFAGFEVVRIFLTMFVWLAIFYFFTKLAWKKGLKVYGAYGR